jgi:UDP-N-acetylmuramoyl-tripeptide--D-alanyl-D-alanine ligase
MTAPLWHIHELIDAAGGEADGTGPASVSGISIDSRTLAPGDLFVALTDARDGHDFVTAAFHAGAAAALVSRDYARRGGDGLLIRVGDPLSALGEIGRVARARLGPDARVVAVTGSVGKTGTKEALRACLAPFGPTHASERSYNNHWGVPLTLARMPATIRFAVFEIGMNHAGEIAPLTRLVRPHVALVTTVAPVHLGLLGSLEAIADAKAEIFLGLEAGGAALLNRDNPFYERLATYAAARGAEVVSFGEDPAADVRAERIETEPDGSTIVARVRGRPLTYRLGAPGLHLARNSLAVLAVLECVGIRTEEAVGPLADVKPPPGRGARTVLAVSGGAALLIDESYNGQPPSVQAAIIALGGVPRARYGRRIAVLGDMLELGAEAERHHLALREVIDAAGVDLVFACGPHMGRLFETLKPEQKALWAPESKGLEASLVAAVRAGDAIMVKGSLGSRMAPLVEALKKKYTAAA